MSEISQANGKAEAKLESKEDCLPGQSFSSVIEGLNETEVARVNRSLKTLRQSASEQSELVPALEAQGYKAVPNGINNMKSGDIVVFQNQEGKAIRATVADYNKDLGRFFTENLEKTKTDSKNSALPNLQVEGDPSSRVTVYRKEFCVNKSKWDIFPNKRD